MSVFPRRLLFCVTRFALLYCGDDDDCIDAVVVVVVVDDYGCVDTAVSANDDGWIEVVPVNCNMMILITCTSSWLLVAASARFCRFMWRILLP